MPFVNTGSGILSLKISYVKTLCLLVRSFFQTPRPSLSVVSKFITRIFLGLRQTFLLQLNPQFMYLIRHGSEIRLVSLRYLVLFHGIGTFYGLRVPRGGRDRPSLSSRKPMDTSQTVYPPRVICPLLSYSSTYV